MTIFTPSRPHLSSLGKPGDAGARWLDWLSKKLFDVDALDLELAREDLPNAPDDAEAPTDDGSSTRTEVGS
jgi:hypothetical protein